MATERATSLDLGLAAPVFGRAGLEEGVLCPFCEYDLRGAANPRCPECGAQFTWPGVPDPATLLHPYLFEHHPEQNVRSFFKTFLNGHRATHFWRTLHPAQPSNISRVVAYWLVILNIYLISSLFFIVTYVAQGRAVLDANSLGGVWPGPTRLLNEFRSLLHESWFPAWLYLVSIFGAWPWITYVVFALFDIGNSRNRINSIHRVRVVVLCADAILWTCLYMVMALSLATANSLLETLGFAWIERLDEILMAGLICVFVMSAFFWLYRLSVAARQYLKVEYSIVVVPLLQVATAIFAYVPMRIIIGFP